MIIIFLTCIFLTKAVFTTCYITYLGTTLVNTSGWNSNTLDYAHLLQCELILNCHITIHYVTCWSIRVLSGLITTPIACSLIASGGRNMQIDFPEPVAMQTETSSYWCMIGSIVSSCPSRKSSNLKYARLHANVSRLYRSHWIYNSNTDRLDHSSRIEVHYRQTARQQIF